MKRSKFSLSNYKLLSMDQGYLTPCGLLEVLPGDSIQQATSCLVRVQPLLAPMMHPVDIRIHHWFVPHRLAWAGWEDFITGGPDGMDDTAFPYIRAPGVGGVPVGSLMDYYGVPTGVPNLEFSALVRRGYGLIWNEWYRDQDLQAELPVGVDVDGLDTVTAFGIQKVAWEKDYFTSARPWPQKGPDITLPLGTTAPVLGIGMQDNITYGAGGANWKQSDGSNTSVGSWGSPGGLGGIQVKGDNTSKVPDIYADLSGATAVSINTVREAFALQRYAEARARYGSRYTEYLRYLGVRSSDARLQRPEYLGGGRQRLQISEVLQTGVTSDGDDSEGVGNMKGHGIGALRTNRYRRFFEEHGYIHSFISVKPKTIYAQGLPRTFARRTREDFWQRELQHIGQQEVYNFEVYAAHSDANGTFGYQDRYDEYRRQESSIAGEFRTTLNFWHMARLFSSDPALNADFVAANPTDRVYATSDTNELWVMVNHSIQARRMVAASGKSFIY